MQLAYPSIGNDLINSDTHIQLNSMQLLETTTLKRSLHTTFKILHNNVYNILCVIKWESEYISMFVCV